MSGDDNIMASWDALFTSLLQFTTSKTSIIQQIFFCPTHQDAEGFPTSICTSKDRWTGRGTFTPSSYPIFSPPSQQLSPWSRFSQTQWRRPTSQCLRWWCPWQQWHWHQQGISNLRVTSSNHEGTSDNSSRGGGGLKVPILKYSQRLLR